MAVSLWRFISDVERGVLLVERLSTFSRRWGAHAETSFRLPIYPLSVFLVYEDQARISEKQTGKFEERFPYAEESSSEGLFLSLLSSYLEM